MLLVELYNALCTAGVSLARFVKTGLGLKLALQVAASEAASRKLSTTAYAAANKYEEPLKRLPPRVRAYVEEKAKMMEPDDIYICDGSDAENKRLLTLMENNGMIKKLSKYENCWLARTDPRDVARVESKTVISTDRKEDTVPDTKEGVKGCLGNWMSPDDLQKAINERFPGCMHGRTMYVVPFSMGPVGGPLSKVGVELTDSPYVVASMRVMTRMGSKVLDKLNTNDSEFVKCTHSVGQPLPMATPPVNNWPCDPERTLISHIPANNEIVSFGSGYGGNSLLGKKCFALRLGSILAQREGWLAEHMLILGITNPAGVKKYVVAAFPSACGKTNLAMLQPTLPGYKVECVGDDIAWMRFDKNGVLRAINPENGFFGVAPGTSDKTNPIAMQTVKKNTIFTNVAETSDGDFYWEGLEDTLKDRKDVNITSWLGEDWKPGCGKVSAHPNSRFCAPAANCPSIDPAWESAEGVPISAIIFGGRRPEGVPLIYESFNWRHGVFMGAAMRSEATAAAEHKGKAIMHDPFAMRPFFGYNFGNYVQHWLSFEKKADLKLPKVFHVNWFRKGSDGKFLWPGFGENCRVLEWICERVEGSPNAKATPIGYVPKELNTTNLKEEVNMAALFDIPTDFWLKETEDITKFFETQVGKDTPQEMINQIHMLRLRLESSKSTDSETVDYAEMSDTEVDMKKRVKIM